MYKIKFSKIKNDHNRLRDDVIEGETEDLPEIGKMFVFYGEGKEFGTRHVNTSLVVSMGHIPDTSKFMLLTESDSIYEVEVLEEPLAH